MVCRRNSRIRTHFAHPQGAARDHDPARGRRLLGRHDHAAWHARDVTFDLDEDAQPGDLGRPPYGAGTQNTEAVPRVSGQYLARDRLAMLGADPGVEIQPQGPIGYLTVGGEPLFHRSGSGRGA